ncbi:MAG: hypothetical protein U0X41_12535 [Chitinophagales bacterium]
MLKSDLFNHYLSDRIFKEVIIEAAYSHKGASVRLSDTYVDSVLRDQVNYLLNNEGPFHYYPVVEFTKSEFTSDMFNITDHNAIPVRYTAHSPTMKSGAYKIYCLGGSTTFGDFVKDTHTWPSFLYQHVQQADSLEVLNFGCEAYSPYQETLLFLSLLRRGDRPSLTIFMDGVNTGPLTDGTEFSQYISSNLEFFNTGIVSNFRKLTYSLPLFKLIVFANFKLIDTHEQKSEDIMPFYTNSPNKRYITSQFIQNARLRMQIAALYNVRILQFLQPNTLLGYKKEYLTKKPLSVFSDSVNIMKTGEAYKALYDAVLQSGCGYIDLSDLLRKYQGPAVVDGMHYSPDFNNFLALHLARYIDMDSLRHFYNDSDFVEVKPFTSD